MAIGAAVGSDHDRAFGEEQKPFFTSTLLEATFAASGSATRPLLGLLCLMCATSAEISFVPTPWPMRAGSPIA